MRKLSNNTLQELITMTNRIIRLMDEEFSHVSGNVPAEVNQPINKYYAELCKEQERRENI